MKEREEKYNPTDQELKQNIETTFGTIRWGMVSAIGWKVNVPELGELEDDTPLLNAAFSQETNEQKFILDFMGSTHTIRPVVNQSKYKEVCQKGQKVIDEWNDLIHENIPDDPLAPKIEALVKAVTTNRLQRAVEGYSDDYLNSRLPIQIGLEGLIADAGIVADEKLAMKMRESQESFPVFDCILEADEQLDTMVGYWKEKEKGISAEREEQYRETLYSQTISLLSKVNKLSDTTMNNRPESERLQRLGVTEADPFQLSKYSPRGSITFVATLEAQRTGLENGWALDDLSVLSSFNYIRQVLRRGTEYTASTTFDTYQKFDTPRYPSPEYKDYLDKLDSVYKSIEETPLKNYADRSVALNKMYQTIEEGVQRGFLKGNTLSRVDYFNRQYENARNRDAAIAEEREIAVGKPLKNQVRFNRVDSAKETFETSRASIFKKESPEHKAVRESYDTLLKIKKGMRVNPSLEQQLELLDAIDRLDHNTRTYIQKRKGASTEAGKERLKGARRIQNYVDKERIKFVKLINQDRKPDQQVTLNQFRREVVANQMSESIDMLQGIENLGTGISNQELSSRIADVLVHQFANSRNETTMRVFENTGAAVLKEEILKNKEFQKMTKSYQDKGISGEALSADLLSGECMKKIASMKQKKEKAVEEQQKKMDAIKVKPKNAGAMKK